MNNRNENETTLIDLNILSTIIFILTIFISLGITINERNKITGKNYINDDKILNVSFYNRIVILVAVLISLYVGYENYINENDNTTSKYKNYLLLLTNILTVISAIIILYVSYMNKEEQSLNVSNIENPLI